MKIIEVITDTNIGGAGVLLINRLKYTDISKYDTEVAKIESLSDCYPEFKQFSIRKSPVAPATIPPAIAPFTMTDPEFIHSDILPPLVIATIPAALVA